MSLKFYLSISFCLFFMWLYSLIKCDELPKYESLWITNKTINALSSIVFFIFQILVMLQELYIL